MMRKFLSLFAVLAAGWVGATMVTWSGPSITAPKANEKSAGTSWIKITVTFTAPKDVSNATSIFTMLGDGLETAKGSNEYYKQGMVLRIKDGQVNAVSRGQGDNGISPHDMGVATGGKEYEVVFEGKYGKDSNAGTFDFVYSGYNQTDSKKLKAATVNRIRYVADSDFTLQYDDELVDNITIVYDEQTFSVPEPTALALLALGLTGLALRRRIA